LPGRIQEFVQGGLKFVLFPGGGSAPVGARKPPKINRFLWSKGGLCPPPDYASGCAVTLH